VSVAALKAVPPVTGAEHRIAELQAYRRKLAAEIDEVSARRQALEFKLAAVTSAVDALGATRSERAAAAGAQLAAGQPVKLRDHDERIAAKERELAAARRAVAEMGDEDGIRQAVAYLDEHAQALQRDFDDTRGQVLAAEREAAVDRLAGLAPTLQADIQRLIGTLVEVGAQADIANLLGATVRRRDGVSVAVSSASVGRVSIGVPAHPGYDGLSAGINISEQIAGRVAQIKRERGLA
jgi:hypothetical protein